MPKGIPDLQDRGPPIAGLVVSTGATWVSRKKLPIQSNKQDMQDMQDAGNKISIPKILRKILYHPPIIMVTVDFFGLNGSDPWH